MSYRQDMREDRAAEREQDRQDKKMRIEAQLEAQRIAAADERETARIAAEQKREDERLAAEQKRLDEEAAAEKARKDAEAKRRQELQDKRQRQADKARAKAARQAKRAKLLGWLNQNPATVFVAYVMVAAVVPAVLSQVGALADSGVMGILAVLLASMLEGGAWALVFLGKEAEAKGRETWKYRLAGWLTSAAAGGVNFWHWMAAAPLWVAFVFGGSSLFAFFIWDLKTHGSDGPTRAERREAKQRRRHDRKRRRHHKDVAKQADRLWSAVPYGTLTEADAFAAAWEIVHGTELGMTPTMYAAATAARLKVGEAFRVAEESRPDLIRAGLLAGLHSPLSKGLAEGSPVLGRLVSAGARSGDAEGPGGQAGIGSYGSGRSSDASGNADENASGNGSGNAGGNTRRKGRTEQELETLLPQAHTVANDLVAEGNPISAAAFAKRMKIRREDGMWLRDRVVAERKLRLIDGDADTAKGA
ncbi:DUF2637 domain-containing protein (plasmid) [Streptomyces sp. BR1]|uniref:DUF2637 domain-containing protein n=1 Tax=Streptomyces sp. BR1 TaxID=1592323 RepID=UPI00402BC7A0